jgi:hypothetical protein
MTNNTMARRIEFRVLNGVSEMQEIRLAKSANHRMVASFGAPAYAHMPVDGNRPGHHVSRE